MDSRVFRSFLFVPANRPERFDKACAAGADAVIVDIEDAVPPGEKESARKALSAWVSRGGSAIIRINAANTEYFSADLALCAMAGVQGVVLPKAESTDDLRRISEGAGRALPLYPIIETSLGFANALPLAKSPNVQRLMFGSIDFQLDLGISGEGEELLYFRSNLVLVSRLAEIQPPVDGVTTSFDNLKFVRADGDRARRLGFGGKLCIHPKQVDAVNKCFESTPEEVAWAHRILDASSSSAGAAVSVDGAMVDRPVIARAEAILARAGK